MRHAEKEPWSSMWLDVTRAPTAIPRLLEWMSSKGMRPVHERNDGVFNQFARFEHVPLVVEITVDRGDWSLAIGATTMQKLFHPDTWEAWDGHFDLAGDLSDLDHQVDFITTRWEAVVHKALKDSATERQMRAIDIDYMGRTYGIWLNE